MRFLKLAAILTVAAPAVLVASGWGALVSPAYAQTQPTTPSTLSNVGPLPSLAPLVRQVTPAVVNVAVESHQSVESNPLFRDPQFRKFFNVPDQPTERKVMAAGSGVIIDAAKGYVMTNNHVIDHADKIVITLKDGRTFTGKLVGTDPGTDIAVVKIPAEDLTALPLGDSGALEVGDYVVAVGNPFGSIPATPAARWSICAASWSASTPPSWRPRAAMSASALPCRSRWPMSWPIS